MGLISSGGSFGSPIMISKIRALAKATVLRSEKSYPARKFLSFEKLFRVILVLLAVIFADAISPTRYCLILVEVTFESGKRKRSGVFMPAKRVYMTNPFPDVGHWRLTQIQIKVTSLRSALTILATSGGSMSQVSSISVRL